jgi:pimeloyl-ACP methyl ester carboxylesterase
MPVSIRCDAGLAYDDEGDGTPVVFLHGLTFDRRTWRPIIDRVGDGVRSIAVDLPAHGESDGPPALLDDVATRLHDLLAWIGADRPILVGHSMSAGLAALYASAYPVRGLVVVDSGPEIRPMAELLHRLEPALRGPGFAGAWQAFEGSLGLERLPGELRRLVLETHVVRQEVVLGYWEMLLRADPATLQREIDARFRAIEAPCLAVFGRPLGDGDRERFGWLHDVQLEEWTGDGHFVHLVEAERFADRLARFVAEVGARHGAASA